MAKPKPIYTSESQPTVAAPLVPARDLLSYSVNLVRRRQLR